MLLPFWLALSTSVVLHIGVLLAPGWKLPLDDEPETTRIEATLAVAPPATPRPTVPLPVKKRAPAKRLPSPSPAAPMADVPAQSPPVEAVPETRPEPAPEPASAPAPEAAPVAAPNETMPAAEEPLPPAVLPKPTFLSHWPRAGRIVYQVTRGESGFIVGQSEQRWEHDDQGYRLHAETATTGLAALFRPAKVVQESRGIFDASGLRPLEFEVQRDGRLTDSVRFEPEQGRITLARGESVPFVAAAQDLLSLFHQLAALPFDVPQFPLTVVTARKVASYVIVVGEELSLDTPQGTRQVRHLKVTGNAREDATEIWLDVETRLPLKIRHRDRKGEIFDQIAIVIETEPLE